MDQIKTRLLSDSEYGEPEDTYWSSSSSSPSRRRCKFQLSTCLNALFFVVSLIMLFFSLNHSSSHNDERLSSFANALNDIQYEDVQMDAALLTQNEFKGPPSPELDQAWESIVQGYPLSIPESEFDKTRKDPLTSVKFPEEQGGGYLGGLEVFHQLHCLRLIRQYTYSDYYSNLTKPPQAFTDSHRNLRLHVDHCIDMIRQVLMCHGDVTLVTHSWVDGYEQPFPDFNTWHQCRNFNALSTFASQNSISTDVKKPKNAQGLAAPPGGHHGGHN